jgi:hypothetical protein
MNVKKEIKNKLQIERELIGFVKEIIPLAKKIETRMPHNPQKKCLDDKSFFYYNFLHRLVDYGNNVVTLVRGKHTHAAVLVARAAFEGLVYVELYRKFYTSLEKKWCYYAIYEAYRDEYERNGKIAADAWLHSYELQHGTAIVKNATEAFVFDKRKQDWHQDAANSVICLKDSLSAEIPIWFGWKKQRTSCTVRSLKSLTGRQRA